MIQAVLSSWALFVGLAFIMLGNGLQGSLLGLRAGLEGFNTTVIGIMLAGYYMGFLLGSWIVPRLVNRVGHIRVFGALASLASLAILVHPIFPNPWFWMAIRILTGMSYAGLYIVCESWLNDRATNETRGQLLSAYLIVMIASVAGGQLLLNLASPGDFELFILVSVLISLAVIPILLTISPAPAVTAPEALSFRALYQASPLGILGIFLVGFAQGSIFSLGAVYASQIGYTVAYTSIFMACLMMGGVLFTWPIGKLSDQFDRRKVILGTAICTMVLSAICVLATESALIEPENFLPMLGVIAIFGGFSTPLYSLCIAHTNDHLQPEQMVAASGSIVMIFGFGSIFGPIISAASMEYLGPGGLFSAQTVAHAAIALFAIWRMTRRPPVPAIAQGPYISIPTRATPVVASMSAEEIGGRQEQHP